MLEEADNRFDGGESEELLRRALLDEDSAVSVSLKIGGLPVSDAVTVIFYARKDLGTLQTYLTPGAHGAGETLSLTNLLRVPVDLDLADAEDREAAERLYAEQARRLRDVLLGADVVLEVWREALCAVTPGVVTDHTVNNPSVQLRMPRLLPTALVEPESQLYVTPVCSARTLAEGQPPVGIACVQQDHARIYALTDDPEACVEDFRDSVSSYAHDLAERLAHQEASVSRFLELSDAA